MIFFMKSKFGKFYRLEFCSKFFSYSSQTSLWCPMVADLTVGKCTVGCLTNLTVFVCGKTRNTYYHKLYTTGGLWLFD